jgi:hypothetical protein
MTTATEALETYDSLTIREDLSDQENMISPYETPFMSMIAGRTTASNTYHEWPLVELAAVDTNNRVAEGTDDPGIDAPTLALRRGNYTQISDKVVKVSDTSQKVDGAANVEKLARQIAYKLKELKRDCESMILDNNAAVPGAGVGATTREAAGLPAFIITNAVRAATGGTAPTLSGTTNGYPDAVGADGTLEALTEDDFNTVIQACWTEGAEVKYSLVGPATKRKISDTFVARSTFYKDADDKKLTLAIDVYESDFGQVQIVPDRFSRESDVFIIDPEYVKIAELQPTRQFPLARTGHTDNRLIQKEYTLEVGNEKALGIRAGIDPAL